MKRQGLLENILNRGLIVKMPSKAWVSDITDIQTKGGFIYLTTIIDLYDRKIIDWSLSDDMSTDDPNDSKQASELRLDLVKWR